MIGLFVNVYLVAKNKREKIKTSSITEIRIMKKLPDELANVLYQTMAFAETQHLSTANNKESLLANLEAIHQNHKYFQREQHDRNRYFVYTESKRNDVRI